MKETKQPRISALAATALCGLLVLCACSPVEADPTPSTASVAVTSGSTPSTTPSAIPTPTTVYKSATAQGPAENVPVPVLPAAAKEFSKEGLEAFARYWYSTLSYAYETGDTEPMMAITDPSCVTCSGTASMLSGWYPNGGWIVGGQILVSSSTSQFNETPDGRYQAVLVIKQAKVTSFKSDGSVDSDLPDAIARPDIVVAKFVNSAWLLFRAEHLTAS